MGKFQRKVIKNKQANQLFLGTLKVVQRHEDQLAALDKVLEGVFEKLLPEKGIYKLEEYTKICDEAVASLQPKEEKSSE